jgi:predicted ATPase
VGRAAETAAIRALLDVDVDVDPDVPDRSRLVTLTGLPGVGKTAAGVAAAAGVAGNFAEGTALIRLDSLRDEALLPHTIAQALRLPDRYDASPLEVLAAELGTRRLLLILDTCEHLIGACAVAVTTLLPSCPGLCVLATSREPLRVPGESVLAIRPLPARDAVTLFARRAAQAAPGFRLTAANHETVAAICGRLDGLPLAIELAARQLTSVSAAALLSALRSGYEFLHDGEKYPPRHRTMWAAIGWSHQLCTPAERLLWARLAVFPGWFGLADAQEICADAHLPEDVVAAALTLLAERSVLLQDLIAAGGGRFRLPATIRAYGMDMLRRLDEEEEIANRYRYRHREHGDDTGNG